MSGFIFVSVNCTMKEDEPAFVEDWNDILAMHSELPRENWMRMEVEVFDFIAMFGIDTGCEFQLIPKN